MLTYIALGSNLGDRRHAIMEAVAALAEVIGPLQALSSIHETEPVDMAPDAPAFLNAVAAFDTTLTPAQLLYVTQAIEQAMGRTEKSDRDHHPDRIIDIDILTLGNTCLDDEEVLPGQHLTLPHPRMFERSFVIEPLSEICDDVASLQEVVPTDAVIQVSPTGDK